MDRSITILTQDSSSLVNQVLRKKSDVPELSTENNNDDNVSNNNEASKPNLKFRLCHVTDRNQIEIELVSLTKVLFFTMLTLLLYA